MSSAVLIERPREDAQVAPPRHEVRVQIAESVLERIALRRREGRGGSPSEGGFVFDADLAESSRTPGRLEMKYRLTFGRPSSGQLCELSGRASFIFSRHDSDSNLEAMGAETYNDMAVEIFRMNYETVYLLHASIGLGSPSPWITQEVSLSSRIQEP